MKAGHLISPVSLSSACVSFLMDIFIKEYLKYVKWKRGGSYNQFFICKTETKVKIFLCSFLYKKKFLPKFVSNLHIFSLSHSIYTEILINTEID